METHVAHLHTNACSQMETHVAHLHMMHVPTWEVCPDVPMLGLGVCSHMGSSHMTRVHVPKHGNTEFSQMWESHSEAFVTQVVPVVRMVQLGMHWEHSFPHGNTCSHVEGTMLLITFVVVIGSTVPSPTSK
jgi:hypothetical protein